MKHKIVYTILALVGILLFSACSAKKAMPGAERVEIVIEKPDSKKCTYLGEVVGSQGNWITGDYTADKDLIKGARNELRNEAYKLGANVVYMQQATMGSSFISYGNNISTNIGKAYKCR